MCDTQSYKSCSGVLQPPHGQVPPSLPTRSPQPLLFSTLPPPSSTAFQEAPSQLPLPTPCLPRDQVLRILAKNEKQLSLLRDLESLKPQKVRTAQGLERRSPLPHSGLHFWLPILPDPPNLLSDGSAKDHRTVGKSTGAPFQERSGTFAQKVGRLPLSVLDGGAGWGGSSKNS